MFYQKQTIYAFSVRNFYFLALKLSFKDLIKSIVSISDSLPLSCLKLGWFTLMNGLMSFSSAMVEGTVGWASPSLWAWHHFNLSWIALLSGSTCRPKVRFWMLYSCPQYTFWRWSNKWELFVQPFSKVILMYSLFHQAKRIIWHLMLHSFVPHSPRRTFHIRQGREYHQ